MYTVCENHKLKSREIICWFTVFFRYCKLFTNAHTATTLCTLSCTTILKKTNQNLTKSDIILHFVKMFHQLSFFQIAIFNSNFVECVHFVENSVSRTYLTNSQYKGLFPDSVDPAKTQQYGVSHQSDNLAG